MSHIICVPQCKKEIIDFPEEVRQELSDALARLAEGHKLSMPQSRPLFSFYKGVHELRFRDRSGVYRIIYFLAGAGVIYLLHAFKKNSQQISEPNRVLVLKRLKGILK